MSGVGAPSPEVVRGRHRAHRARQMRARIVALAQEYREVCDAHEAIARDLWRKDVVATRTLLDLLQRIWPAARRAAGGDEAMRRPRP